MKNKTISVLMMEKNHLLTQMAQLPGVPGASGTEKEEKQLPGVPGEIEEEKEVDPMEAAYRKGYEAGLADAMKHSEPDDDDEDDDDEDDKEQMKKERFVPKMKKIIGMLVKKMSIGEYKSMYSPLYEERDGMSVITIDGELGKRVNEAGKVDVDEIVKALKIAQTANTKATILHINSPGGMSQGIQECGEVIKAMTESKPIFTFCDTICASAAYWLACCTNGIFVTPTAEVGSIGVYAKVMDLSEAYKMQGINPQVFSAGELKTLGQPDKPLNEEESKFIQTDIDEQYIKFKTLVNECRGGVNDEFMQGQLLSGEKSVPANLADEIVPNMETLIASLE